MKGEKLELKEKKKIPNVEELKEIAVGIKNEEDFELGDLEKELLEIYKKRFKGDKDKIKERDFSYWPATEQDVNINHIDNMDDFENIDYIN